MAQRTLHTFGTAKPNTFADIYVDKKLCYSGLAQTGLLFSFTTDVKKHGFVSITIDVKQGSITLGYNRVTYPALIKGKPGFINMPQPIVQPTLETEITESFTYEHYMFNGPTQWIIDSPTNNDETQVVDNFYKAAATGFISPDWQYKNEPVDINNLGYELLING
jgi:hypothetical protein